MAPKNKETDKIKFVKVDTSGGVTSAFPREDATHTEAHHSTDSKIEPAALEDSSISREFRIETHEPLLEEQLDSLKDQVAAVVNQENDHGLTTNETEILKRYISLKEAEARDLRDQHHQYQNHLRKISSELDKHSRKNRDLLSELENTRRREETLRREVGEMGEKHEEQMMLLRNDYEDRLRKLGSYENQVDDLMQKREEWRVKIKEDLKRIKLKERELENKYELLKRDMQALLDSKDKHVLELKKKGDALELEMESLEERLRAANNRLGAVGAKKKRLLDTMRLAQNLLESIDEDDYSAVSEDLDKKVG